MKKQLVIMLCLVLLPTAVLAEEKTNAGKSPWTATVIGAGVAGSVGLLVGCLRVIYVTPAASAGEKAETIAVPTLTGVVIGGLFGTAIGLAAPKQKKDITATPYVIPETNGGIAGGMNIGVKF